MGILNILKRRKRVEKPEPMIEAPLAPPTREEFPRLPSKEELEESEVEKSMDVVAEEYEGKAVREEGRVLEEREDLTLQKPIFIPLNSYKDIVDEIGLIGNLIKEGEDTLVRVSEFDEDSEKEYHKWVSELKDAQKKLIFVDKTLFGMKR